MRLGDIARIDDSKYNTVMKPLLPKGAAKGVLVVGFDSEWNPDTRRLLSVQFAVQKDSGLFSKVYYVSRLNGKILLRRVLQFVRDAHIEQARRIVLVAHFAQSEIGMIADYLRDFKLRLYNRAMSAELIGSEDEEYDFELHQKSAFKIGRHQLQILDLYGYFPTALSVVGKMVGLKKLKMNRAKIHHVLETDKRRFEEYAARDAEVVVCAFNRLRRTIQDRFNVDILHYPTMASLAAAIFRTAFLTEPAVPYRVIPKVTHRKRKDQSWSTVVVRETVYAGSLDVRCMALRCYWGGRAECFGRGLLRAELRYYDVVSLYPSAALLQPLPDKNTDWKSFKTWQAGAHLEGFCHVKFEFPKTQKYPSLPVKPEWADKLYFPLKGESYCTIEEVRAAVKLGAAILEIEGVGFAAAKRERQHVLGAFMQRLIALKQNEPKNSLQRETWKLLINSAIGKFCQRTHEYDETEMVDFMRATGMSDLSDYALRKTFRHQTRVGSCWSPEWAALILGRARALIAELTTKGSLLCSTDSGLFLSETNLECEALRLLHSVGSDFESEPKYEGDAALLIRSRMYAILRNGKIVKCTKHGTIAKNADFAQIIKDNLNAKRDLGQTVHKTHLYSLRDVVRKGVKLGQQEEWERSIKWDWDGKRLLTNPTADLWTEYTDTAPLPELPDYPPTQHNLKGGRPTVLTATQQIEIVQAHKNGVSIKTLAQQYKVGAATIQRATRKNA
jgi:hypothetical protein